MTADASRPRTAAALIIGTELLTGKIPDANLVVLARALRELGVQLRRAVTVLDDLDVIASEVASLSASHDWVFTSGGVGPTHDDVTVDAVAKAFDGKVRSDPDMEAALRKFYGEKITDGHLRMARVPEGARLIHSKHLPWPTVVMRNVWVLPGVPQIFKMKVPVIKDELGAESPFVCMTVFTTLDEGALKATLDEVVAEFEGVEVGSYPRWEDPEARTKLTFDGTNRETVRKARDAFVERLPKEAIVRVEDEPCPE